MPLVLWGLAGLHSLLVLVPWLYSSLKIAGGAHAFLSGMLTQLSNPNTAIVFGSIFAATLG